MKVRIDGRAVYIEEQGRYFTCSSDAQAACLASIIREGLDAAYIEGRNDSGSSWKWGWIMRKGSAWMGVHYSEHNKRWCINLIPCVTFWVTKPGGTTP